MRYLSVCAGIEAATVAWHPLGWTPAAFAEIDAFPRAVLAHHYPDVPLHGDFTTIKGTEYGAVDLLVGGTPCQDFSIAGLRAGLAGERGNLTLEFLRLAGRTRPRWMVWENVPGVLSSDGGRALGAFLGGLAELGYGFAYRVLDAQFFGLAQRRERVFVVGYLGDWRRAAAVLFERESLRWNPAPRREARERVARPIARGTDRSSGYRNDADTADNLIASTGDISHCPNAGGMGRLDFESETFIAHAFDARQSDVIQYGDRTGPLDTHGHSIAVAFTAKDHGADATFDLSPTLRAGGHSKSHANGGVMPAIAYAFDARQSDVIQYGDRTGPLDTDGHSIAVQTGWRVRRLTPMECERLQGFPDRWTEIPWRGRPAELCPDGPRYRSLGNSMAVPCMAWIGRRIALVESLTAIKTAA